MKKNNSKKKSLYSKIASWIVVILVLFAVIKVSTQAAKGEIPSLFGLSISNVPTNSMEDKLMPGDVVLFHHDTFENCKVGDIVVYHSKENHIYIIHRVLEKHQTYLIMKGDNNPSPDSEQVTSDMVVGKYVRTLANFGENSMFSDKRLIFGVLLFLIMILIITQIVNIVIAYKLDKKKKESLKISDEDIKKIHDRIIKEEIEKFNNKNK